MKKITTLLCFALLFTFVSTTDAQKRRSSDSDSQTVKKEQKKKSKKKRTKKRRATKKGEKTADHSVSKSVRIFNMGEGVLSTGLIGAWEVKSACVFEPGFEGTGLCATSEDLQDYINNINVLVKDNGTGFFDANGEREDLTWIENNMSGLQVDIGDDDFGQFSLSLDGELTISDDFESECLNDGDEVIEGVDNESDCTNEGGSWEEAASMVYIFTKLSEGEYDTETGSKIVSSSRKSWWKRAKRRARKAVRRAAAKAQRVAEQQASRAAELAAAAIKAAEEEAKKIALRLVNDANKKFKNQINKAGDIALQLSASAGFTTVINTLASQGTPTVEQVSTILDECDLLGKFLEELNDKGMKTVFFGSSGTEFAFAGSAHAVTFAISIKDLLTVWDDLKHFREPSLTPNMAIQHTHSLVVSIGGDAGLDVIFGWNTDEPQDTFGDFWDFSTGIGFATISLGTTSAIAAPKITLKGASGGRYLGQTFSFSAGTSGPAEGDITFGFGKCCIFHINNNMKHRCN